jgi:hypothetical protein
MKDSLLQIYCWWRLLYDTENFRIASLRWSARHWNRRICNAMLAADRHVAARRGICRCRFGTSRAAFRF